MRGKNSQAKRGGGKGKQLPISRPKEAHTFFVLFADQQERAASHKRIFNAMPQCSVGAGFFSACFIL